MMVTVEELQSAIIFAKADELSYRKATEDAHDRLMLAVGRLQGYQEAKAELETKFGLPLTPEIESQVMAIIRDVKAKATTGVI